MTTADVEQVATQALWAHDGVYAEPFYRELVRRYTDQGPLRRRELSAALTGLGESLDRERNPRGSAEAEPALLAALALRQKLFGPQGDKTGATASALARLYTRLGRPGDATRVRAEAGLPDLYATGPSPATRPSAATTGPGGGEDDPSLLARQGAAQAAAGRYATAESSFRRGVAGVRPRRDRRRRPGHPRGTQAVRRRRRRTRPSQGRGPLVPGVMGTGPADAGGGRGRDPAGAGQLRRVAAGAGPPRPVGAAVQGAVGPGQGPLRGGEHQHAPRPGQLRRVDRPAGEAEAGRAVVAARVGDDPATSPRPRPSPGSPRPTTRGCWTSSASPTGPGPCGRRPGRPAGRPGGRRPGLGTCPACRR